MKKIRSPNIDRPSMIKPRRIENLFRDISGLSLIAGR